MASEKIYMPDYDETALEFVRRVVRDIPPLIATRR